MLTLSLILSLLFTQNINPLLGDQPKLVSIESNVFNIENGWYKASVKYYNPKTYTRSTYTLNVKVEYNRVTVIDFGNGGSVHSGYNNSGYYYNGGTLFFKKDYQGNITSATTTVSITEGYNTVSYEITI